jgi:hypothetical protein
VLYAFVTITQYNAFNGKFILIVLAFVLMPNLNLLEHFVFKPDLNLLEHLIFKPDLNLLEHLIFKPDLNLLEPWHLNQT